MKTVTGGDLLVHFLSCHAVSQSGDNKNPIKNKKFKDIRGINWVILDKNLAKIEKITVTLAGFN